MVQEAELDRGLLVVAHRGLAPLAAELAGERGGSRRRARRSTSQPMSVAGIRPRWRGVDEGER